jgi:hypothetical protein
MPVSGRKPTVSTKINVRVSVDENGEIHAEVVT